MPFIIESDSGNGWCIRQRCPELNAELSHKPDKLRETLSLKVMDWLKVEPATKFRITEVDQLFGPVDLNAAYEYINQNKG